MACGCSASCWRRCRPTSTTARACARRSARLREGRAPEPRGGHRRQPGRDVQRPAAPRGHHHGRNHHPGGHDSGDHDSGDHDSGDHDSGDHDSGDHDSGDHDSGDHHFGWDRQYPAADGCLRDRGIKPPPETVKKPLIGTDYVEVKVELADEKLSEANRLASSLAALLQNVEGVKISKANEPAPSTASTRARCQGYRAGRRADRPSDERILHHPSSSGWRPPGAAWRTWSRTPTSRPTSPSTSSMWTRRSWPGLREELERHLLQRPLREVYIKEYDQYGGRPYGT